MKDAHGNARAIECLTTEKAVIAHIVYGKNDRNISHERIVAVGSAQQHGHECGLPIVAVDYVGMPEMLGDFNRGAAKLTVALGIIRIIAAGTAVEPVAIKIGGIVYKKIANAVDYGTVGNGWKTEACAAHGNRHAGHDHGTGLRSAVARQHNRDFMAEADQGLRQSLNDVREAPGFGKGQAF